MGLDASVMCNCLEHGLTVPERFKPYFIINDDGYPELALPYPGNEEIHQTFDNWLATACRHPDMNFVNLRVSNWAGVRLFQEFVQSLHRDDIHILLDEIPDANGGHVHPHRAEKMLHALRRLKDSGHCLEKTVLVDGGSGDVIWEHIPAYRGKMILSGSEGIHMGITEEQFFIETLDGALLFSSLRFRQHITDLARTENHLDSPVVYTDDDTGVSFTCLSAIPGKQIPWPDGQWQDKDGRVRFEYPGTLQVRTAVRTGDDHLDIIETLIALCEASVETNNRIRWI